jgi:3-hydroxyisobutyrate dehydrogenase
MRMKAAFIGLGTMGAAMALNILKAGHSLTVYNRNRDRELPLEKEGAKRAATPLEAAAAAEVVVICVSDTPDVEEIILGNAGVIHGAKPGTVVVDCSTISPAATRKMGQTLAQKGIKMIDAPVSGGSEGAVNATLAIMIGGEAQDVEKVMPVLEAMGKTITHVGPLGAGQITKAINQTILCGYYQSLGEGMALGIKAGLDMEKVVRAIEGGACNSWVLTYRSENMIKNEYPLGFRVSLHNKDMRIALETARELGVSLPVAGLVAQIENGLIGRGFGDEDVSNLARATREQSGID